MSQQLGLFDAPPRPMTPLVDLRAVKAGGRPEVRYRSPDDPGLAWTGRGKPPRWITQWIESGKSLEALLVSGAQP